MTAKDALKLIDFIEKQLINSANGMAVIGITKDLGGNIFFENISKVDQMSKYYSCFDDEDEYADEDVDNQLEDITSSLYHNCSNAVCKDEAFFNACGEIDEDDNFPGFTDREIKIISTGYYPPVDSDEKIDKSLDKKLSCIDGDVITKDKDESVEKIITKMDWNENKDSIVPFLNLILSVDKGVFVYDMDSKELIDYLDSIKLSSPIMQAKVKYLSQACAEVVNCLSSLFIDNPLKPNALLMLDRIEYENNLNGGLDLVFNYNDKTHIRVNIGPGYKQVVVNSVDI